MAKVMIVVDDEIYRTFKDKVVEEGKKINYVIAKLIEKYANENSRDDK